MHLSALQYVTLLLLLVSSECIKIRKCCKHGENLVGQNQCARYMNKNSSHWLPAKHIFASSWSQVSNKISNDMTEQINRIYGSRVDIGFPNCTPEYRDLVLNSEENPPFSIEFYLVYEPKRNQIQLNFVRKSRFHDTITPAFSNLFPPESYCVDSGPDNRYYAVLCPCTELTCVRKCCHENCVLDEDTHRCVSVDDLLTKQEDIDNYTDWRPKFAEFGGGNYVTGENKYFLMTGKEAPCENLRQTYIDPEGDKTFFFLSDGSIQINSSSSKSEIIPAGEHCGELGWKKSTGKFEPILLRCFPHREDANFYAPFFTISAIFLISSALVLLLDLNPDVEGRRGTRCLVGHVTSLAVAHVISALSSSYLLKLGSPYCILSGYIMQFSFLAAFFWLNVMCIDMSWTFSGLRAPNGSRKDRDRKKFMWYSVYGWGGPSLLLILALVFEYASIVPEDSTFKPNVGLIKCWFRDTGALWLFFYGPMAFLLITNMVLFIYTSFRIIVLRRGDGALHQDDSQRHGGRGPSSRDRQRFALYAKLFSLMGISWLTEIISWAVGGSNYIWLFTDSINLLRAFFIFVIFCWKPRVWKSIKSRLACIRKCEQVANRLCCGKILHMDGHNEDQRTTSTTNSIPKDTSTKVDGVEMAPA